MKRTIITLTVCFLLLLAGCGAENDSSKSSGNNGLIEISATSVDWDKGIIKIKAKNNSDKDIVLHQFDLNTYDDNSKEELFLALVTPKDMTIGPGAESDWMEYRTDSGMRTIIIYGYGITDDGYVIYDKSLYMAFQLKKTEDSTEVISIYNKAKVKKLMREFE